VTSRADVHYVVTGIWRGESARKTLRQRAEALPSALRSPLSATAFNDFAVRSNYLEPRPKMAREKTRKRRPQAGVGKLKRAPPNAPTVFDPSSVTMSDPSWATVTPTGRPHVARRRHEAGQKILVFPVARPF